MKQLTNDRFSLVLSGGAALGCAHLGVLDAMEQRNLVPREIVGTSMGAIVGAAYAFGFSCEEIAKSFDRFAGITNWVRLSWSKPSFFNAEKISEIFEELFGDRLLGEAQCPVKIVATDFENGKAKIFTDEVPVKIALLGTMSIPVLFPPVFLEGRVYVDGFLCANLPIEYATPPVIAVDVMSLKSLPPLEMQPSTWGKAKALVQAYERTFYHLVHSQTQAALDHSKDVILMEPQLNRFQMYNFDEWEALRRAGREEAEKVFDSLKT